MRVDELNDETERAMDAMTDRIRALEAQLATARASSDRWHGVAHRMEAERDAAVKRAEEAEGRFRTEHYNHRHTIETRDELYAEVASLRSRLSEAQKEGAAWREAVEWAVGATPHPEAHTPGWGKDRLHELRQDAAQRRYLSDLLEAAGLERDRAQAREGRYREALEYADGVLERLPTTIRREVKRLNAHWRAGLTDARAAREKIRAALSPSPVSTRCPVCRAPAGQPHKMSCRPHDRAVKHYVEPSPVSGAAAPTLTAAMVCPHTPQYACPRCQPERFVSGVAAKEPGKDGAA